MVTDEQRLEQLARYYGSDIVDHGYIPYLVKYLPNRIMSLLEVGVLNGASARMFDEFYAGYPEIHLIDLFGEYRSFTPRKARELGFVPFQMDQSDTEALQKLPIKYDVISEDGSHRSDHQIITFKELFWGKLKQGGVYFCQDTHCCKDESYWGGWVTRFDFTILGMFKRFLEDGRIVNPYFTDEDAAVFKKLIDIVEICADEKLIVIKRK